MNQAVQHGVIVFVNLLDSSRSSYQKFSFGCGVSHKQSSLHKPPFWLRHQDGPNRNETKTGYQNCLLVGMILSSHSAVMDLNQDIDHLSMKMNELKKPPIVQSLAPWRW